MTEQTQRDDWACCKAVLVKEVGPTATEVIVIVASVVFAAVTGWLSRQRAAREVARLKVDRNAHAERANANELRAVKAETKLDSLSPPAFPRPAALGEFTPTPTPVIITLPPTELQSVPPSEPPRDIAGDPVDEALETADTVPPRGKR